LLELPDHFDHLCRRITAGHKGSSERTAASVYFMSGPGVASDASVASGYRVMWRRRRSQLDEFRRSALHYAAADGDVERARAELAAGAAVDAADANGWTPLHFAAQSQSAPIVRQLIEKGVSVDVPDSQGNTPLWRAVFAYNGDPATIRLLRDAGADPLRKNKHGVSPASLARTIANYDVAKCFADVPADGTEAI
jgi:ankyrin repeat protein